jgi:hypothetical protein
MWINNNTEPISSEQVKEVHKWLNEWESLRLTAIPLRFLEEFGNMKRGVNVKIDDTTAFGCSHHNHNRHRVYIDGLSYDEALILQKIISKIIS